MILRNSILIIIFMLAASSLAQDNGDNQSKTVNKKATNQTVSENTSIKWYTFEEAIKLNEGFPKKKIFIDMYTDWCGWCKKMDAVTFKHPEIVKYLNEHYWAVKFDAEGFDTIVYNGVKYVNPKPPGTKRSTHQLAITLLSRQMTYPSYVFLNENNQLLTVVKGYIKPKSFEPVVHYFGDNSHFSKSWEEFTKTFVGVISD
ncbi:thioredoxin family protein [candidate division KSB1 bacterium]